MRLSRRFAIPVAVACCFSSAVVCGNARGQAVAEEARAFTIASGAFSLETEFAVLPEAEGEQPGRMTVMGAGGSVQANVDRWYGQFAQPDGSETKDKATTKTLKLAGCTVTFVDVGGTYKDMPGGPFAGGKSVDRPDYRMLAAIVETPKEGSYFLKFYGPGTTVAKQADGFRTMVAGMVATAT